MAENAQRIAVLGGGPMGLAVAYQLALDGHQPLAQALAFWQRIDRAEPEQVDFGLADLLDVPVRYLSTGQIKRAALARLIVPTPQ